MKAGIIVPPITVVAVALLGVVIEWLLPIPPPGRIFDISDVLKLAIERKYDLIELQIFWALGLVGGIIVLLKFDIEGKVMMSYSHLVWVFSATLCAFSSAYFGHLYIDRLSLILSLELNPFNDKTLPRLGYIQFLALVMAFILSVCSYLVTLSQKEKP
jgi:hypothetical protein